ncbi:MAG: hypothetical protein U0P81_03350 [Holophagaceae bacterium]
MLPPPASLQAPPPDAKASSLPEAEERVLAAFDQGLPPPAVKVPSRDRAALAWLVAQASPAGPAPVAPPFPKGSPLAREAKAWRDFLASRPDRQAEALAGLPLAHTGTQLALWRWLQSRGPDGLAAGPRRLAEDRLAASPVPLIRGYALRHALCFAVAEGDESRFLDLRRRHDVEEGDLFRSFQRLFSLVGGPAPRVRLYRLPGLELQDLSLADLGGRRIWMMPRRERLEALPAATAWIIPSASGSQDEGEPSLDPQAREEAEGHARLLREAGRQAWFAASRAPFEALGLMYFPLQIDLDVEGRVQRIRMGDAAPLAPE